MKWVAELFRRVQFHPFLETPDMPNNKRKHRIRLLPMIKKKGVKKNSTRMGFEKGCDSWSIGGLRNDAIAQQEPASRHGFVLASLREKTGARQGSNTRRESEFEEDGPWPSTMKPRPKKI